jgi:imidazoleglycerol-phosphate dehydratase/histidinol-phosphatase
MSRARILFIGRDGTIVEDPHDGQVDTLQKLRQLPGLAPALLELRQAGYRLVLISDPDGLGTPPLPESALREAQDFLRTLCRAGRTASIRRITKETSIEVEVNLDRPAPVAISTGIAFFDHMLEQVARHGGFSLQLECKGDLAVDEHHTVEDCALALGQALREALGDKRGIARYGFLLPMDEARAQVAIDLSGRPYAVFEGHFTRDAVGGLPTELVPHFFRSLGESLGAAIHIQVTGENTHHMVEACFKGVGRALRQALRIESTELPSSKGAL